MIFPEIFSFISSSIKEKFSFLNYNNIKQNILNLYIKIIFIFSKIQIFFFKINNKITKSLQFILNNKIKKENEIMQIKNNGEIYIKHHENELIKYFEPENNNIFIFSDNKNQEKNKYINKVISNIEPINIQYEESNIKFILLELKIADFFIKIDLKTDKYNFFIVNNIINKNFLIYFLNDFFICNLKKYYQNIKEIESFTIKLIDQNVNLKELEISDKKYILINKNDYSYVNNYN
jgi:hypothetical protein